MQNFDERKKWYLAHKDEINKFYETVTKEDNEFYKKYDEESNKEFDDLYKKLGLKRKKRNRKLKPLIFKPITDENLIKIAELSITNSIKQIESIDLTPYLNKIKNKKIEYKIALFIKNNKVIDESIFTSKAHGRVSNPKQEKAIQEKAKKLKAKVYMVHNHPFYIQAIPSSADIRSFRNTILNYKKEGIEVIDCAVVTNYDYYSYFQRKQEAKKILKAAKGKGINNKLELEIIELMYLERNNYLNKYKKRHIYQFIDEKRETTDNIPTKEYEEIRRNAKKHLLEIEKELNID